MTLDIGSAYNDTENQTPNQSTVQLTKNGTDTGLEVQTSFDYSVGRRTGLNGYKSDATHYTDASITFYGGQVLNFRTSQGGSNTNRGVVCVWFERLE